ncbi:MAG TPA: hypothetical protein VIH98_10020, partial [Xanthobacteraceae bacterium]
MPPSDQVVRESREDNLGGNFRLYPNNAGVFGSKQCERFCQNEKAPVNRSPPHRVEDERLFERGLDAGEGRVQLRAEALHDCDDRNR